MQDGLYIPSDSDVKKCESGKGCDYGICDECIICGGNNVERRNEENV